jgi:hypothetical protein
MELLFSKQRQSLSTEHSNQFATVQCATVTAMEWAQGPPVFMPGRLDPATVADRTKQATSMLDTGQCNAQTQLSACMCRCPLPFACTQGGRWVISSRPMNLWHGKRRTSCVRQQRGLQVGLRNLGCSRDCAPVSDATACSAAHTRRAQEQGHNQVLQCFAGLAPGK